MNFKNAESQKGHSNFVIGLQAFPVSVEIQSLSRVSDWSRAKSLLNPHGTTAESHKGPNPTKPLQNLLIGLRMRRVKFARDRPAT